MDQSSRNFLDHAGCKPLAPVHGVELASGWPRREPPPSGSLIVEGAAASPGPVVGGRGEDHRPAIGCVPLRPSGSNRASDPDQRPELDVRRTHIDGRGRHPYLPAGVRERMSKSRAEDGEVHGEAAPRPRANGGGTEDSEAVGGGPEAVHDPGTRVKLYLGPRAIAIAYLRIRSNLLPQQSGYRYLIWQRS